ncbi:MAG TPA: CBS domain-containing protein [Streptosporangiaceae bacterium]|nr:CBS domain-containing protein [Streptosporangiaceae bacterium]
MSRKDMHLDAMLRHLGAAYYDSLNGRAAPADVDRAVDQVAYELGDKPGVQVAPLLPRAGESHREVPKHHGRARSRVRDVMTTDVVTVDQITPFKEIARLLVEHHITAVPVLQLGRHVTGVVSEVDLIAARDEHAGTRKRWTGMPRYGTDHDRYLRLTAAQLMTSPAVTIHPDATIPSAARLMTTHHVKRLPVVDSDGKLVGLVSERDLLGVFLVPDQEIARQVREALAETLPAEPDAIKVAVHGGIVTMTGQPDAALPHSQVATAIELIWTLDGVVDVLDHITSPQPA